jgi:hypothetical protein
MMEKWKYDRCDDGTWMVCTDGDVILTIDKHQDDATASMICEWIVEHHNIQVKVCERFQELGFLK